MTDDTTNRSHDAGDDGPVDEATRDALRDALRVTDGPSEAVRQAHLAAALAAADEGEPTRGADGTASFAARPRGSGMWLRGLAAAAAVVIVAGVGVRMIASGSDESSEDAATSAVSAGSPGADSDARASSEAAIAEKSMSDTAAGSVEEAGSSMVDLGTFSDSASLARALQAAASTSTTMAPPDPSVTPPGADPLTTDSTNTAGTAMATAEPPAEPPAEPADGQAADTCRDEQSSRTGLRATAILGGDAVVAIASDPPVAIRLRDCTIIEL